MPQRRNIAITANFLGAASPVGSIVRFQGADGHEIRGKVVGMRVHHADVIAEDATEWSVPWPAIIAVESAPVSECTLIETEDLGKRLLAQYQTDGQLGRRWTFGFDLSPVRAGVCRYREQRIDLSVSFCLRAARAEIADTVLHEIAHAIVGPRHNHDAVWKAKAQEIGCAGERCHRVPHFIARWVGECGCGQQWFRQTLQRRIKYNRVCATCQGTITWRRNTDPAIS